MGEPSNIPPLNIAALVKNARRPLFSLLMVQRSTEFASGNNEKQRKKYDFQRFEALNDLGICPVFFLKKLLK